MKSIYPFFYLFLLLGITACSDILDTVPNDRLSTQLYWKVDDDAKLAANAIYAELENFPESVGYDVYTDMAHFNYYAGDVPTIERGSADALNNIFLDSWKKYYRGIRLCNDYMANIDRVSVSNAAFVNSITAEVRTFRAYFYFRLISRFGDVPLILTPITISESKQLTRTPIDQIWTFIFKELVEAEKDLPLSQTEKGRITKGAALSIRAKAALFKGDYQQAATAAQGVMDLGVYELYPKYSKLFSYEAENCKEVILDKQYIKDQYPSSVINSYGARSLGGNGAEMVPTRSLLDAYQMSNGKAINDPASGYDPRQPYLNRDPRLSYTIFVPGDLLPNGKIYDSRPGSGTSDAYSSSFQASTTGLTPKKYINPEDASTPNNCGINNILIRYAEILLTYAEAKIELNQIDNSVLKAINDIRTRSDVNMPVVELGNQSEMRKIVRHERTIELALEGARYLDIKRWKIGSVCNGPILGMSYINAAGTLVFIEDKENPKLFKEDKDYLWPIPYNERVLNPNLTQNPKW